MTMKKKSDEDRIEKLIRRALKEDIGEGDHSTLACIDRQSVGVAVLKIKEDCVVAGINIAERIFKYVEPGVEFKAYIKDGEQAHKGDAAFRVKGKIHTILSCERLVLNCMQRMSGIATLTRIYVNELQGYKSILLDTRKTTPNFRILEKEAVKMGGGSNYRFGLYDMIMLKDNHIDYAGGIEKAIKRVAGYKAEKHLKLPVIIEARKIDDIKEIMGVGKVDRIMLDNFSPDQIKDAMKLINGQYETEASGGITPENIKEYAATGVTYISSGALIHQAKSVDMSLKAE